MPHTTTYGYDALGRVVTMTYPDGEDVSFTYDTLDRLVGASGAYSESYAYDAIGNLLSEGDTNYTYDPQSTSCPDGALSKPHAVVTAGMEALASAHAKAAPD